MLRSFSEFKFYQSFRIPVEKVDGLRFLVEQEDERGKSTYIEDAVLVDAFNISIPTTLFLLS